MGGSTLVYACPCPSKPRTGLGDVLGAEGLARKFKELSSEVGAAQLGQIFDLSCKRKFKELSGLSPLRNICGVSPRASELEGLTAKRKYRGIINRKEPAF